MDWTDRHYRFMMRLITKNTLLYTEMLVDQTVRTNVLLRIYVIVKLSSARRYANDALCMCGYKSKSVR